MDVTFVIGNNSWKFHDDMMMGTWWKRCDRQTDGRTDGQTDGQTDRQTDWTSHIAAWSQLKIGSNTTNHHDNMFLNACKCQLLTCWHVRMWVISQKILFNYSSPCMNFANQGSQWWAPHDPGLTCPMIGSWFLNPHTSASSLTLLMTWRPSLQTMNSASPICNQIQHAGSKQDQISSYVNVCDVLIWGWIQE